MGTSGRFALFLGIVLSVWTLFHVYAFQRAFSIPAVARAVPFAARVSLLALLWLSYPVGRVLARSAPGALARGVELFGAVWMGVLFLAFASLFVADVATGFGKLWPRGAVPARSMALAVAGVLSAAAIVQAARGPRVVRHEVKVDSLPGGRTELTLVQLSDLHLGTLLGERWLGKRVAQVNALGPDLVVVTGDLVDSEVGPVGPLAPVLRGLSAPMGVWGVTGNHEYYAGLERCLAVYEAAGIRTLRDGWAEAAPGLVLTGVDDLTARRQLGLDGRTLDRAFAGVPKDAVVVHLSHSPLLVREAASRGTRLMLSGHTHGGQLWPFTFLSAIPYPFQAGRYEVDGMTLAVSRGTGIWGPPMRLCFRSEIVEVILRT
ncbi:MAG TPA: metallophosphoesterase [Thermoanaerobaculia bacterium]|nr:metallophosphoesterase [Thermoanaerobaculia bacterium]